MSLDYRGERLGCVVRCGDWIPTRSRFLLESKKSLTMSAGVLPVIVTVFPVFGGVRTDTHTVISASRLRR